MYDRYIVKFSSQNSAKSWESGREIRIDWNPARREKNLRPFLAGRFPPEESSVGIRTAAEKGFK